MPQSVAEPVGIERARALPGLRLVLLQGLPSPWSQAARSILDLEQIPYVRVHRTPEDAPDALLAWTGQDAFPAAVYEEETARTGWAEILLLAERLAPKPALIPGEPARRAQLFGVAHEICGEMGLGWCRRLQTISKGLAREEPDPISVFLGRKYGHRPESAAAAGKRVVEVLQLLSGMLAESRAAGGHYLMGAELTALDIYWATFCNLLSPLPAEQMPMSKRLRPLFTATEPETLAALDPALLELRDRIYSEHLTLPVQL